MTNWMANYELYEDDWMEYQELIKTNLMEDEEEVYNYNPDQELKNDLYIYLIENGVEMANIDNLTLDEVMDTYDWFMDIMERGDEEQEIGF